MIILYKNFTKNIYNQDQIKQKDRPPLKKISGFAPDNTPRPLPSSRTTPRPLKKSKSHTKSKSN